MCTIIVYISFTASPPRATTHTPPAGKYQPKKTSFPPITLAKSMYVNWYIDW